MGRPAASAARATWWTTPVSYTHLDVYKRQGGTFINKDLAGVGCLADIGCYGLDMALNAIGYPKPLTVSAYAADFFGKNPKYYPDADKFTVDDFAVAFVRLEGGIALDFRMSWAMHMDTMGDTLFLGKDAGLKVKSPGLGSAWGGAWDGTKMCIRDSYGGGGTTR